jgi:hypothetical protein
MPYTRFSTVGALYLGFLISSFVSFDTANGSGAPNRQDRVALLRDDLPGYDSQLADAITSALEQFGFEVSHLTTSDAGNRKVLSADQFFLYIVPNCRTYPADALDTLLEFSRNRGHLLMLGGPLLDNPVWRRNGKWLDRDAVNAAMREVEPEYRSFDLTTLDPSRWTRTCNVPKSGGSWKLAAAGPDGIPCLAYHTENLSGWDGYLSPTVDHLYGDQHDLFTFLAKGGSQTRQLAVEIQETDGSRWIAVADLTVDWQRISLAPSDFKYWPDSSTSNTRGGKGDLLRPDKAQRLNFQLAQSHTLAVLPGDHRFWVADIGTLQNPLAGMRMEISQSTQSLATLFPRYKVYNLCEPLTLRSSSQQHVIATIDPIASGDVVCAVPRTMGRGFRRNQKWRYLPLLEATDSAGRYRGEAAWLLLNRDRPFVGSVFACLGLNETTQAGDDFVPNTVSRIAQRLRSGALLAEAGTEHFAYWPHESVHFGAIVANVSDSDRTAILKISVANQLGEQVLSKQVPVAIPAREQVEWSDHFELNDKEPMTYSALTELWIAGKCIDRIEHELAVLDSASANDDEFIKVRGNDFYLGDQKWYPVGVNFWPLYVSGMEHEDFWAGWLRHRYYEPSLVELDLQRLESLGINMVSIQANEPEYYRNLRDFLRRCRNHDIHVNLFCGLASPIAFRESALRQFIATARLADNPTIMAYDTIWEPGNYVFRKDWRSRWNADWSRWVVEQYGSVTAAEKEWGVATSRDSKGWLESPPDPYFREDGSWRIMMAAYRRFMDDLMSRKWNQASRALRSIDPNHLISFRQGNTLPHDFTFTATPKHIDFICPEGYAISHNNDGYNTAGFITRFVHFTTGGKPIVWSEFGQSVWDVKTMDFSPSRLESVADYHELFYRMVIESGANGTVPWWWPGGYRVGERSDYGIVNPDGTSRPAADLLTKYGPRLKENRDWPEPTAWYEMDLDAHSGGYCFLAFNDGKDAYRKAIADGKQLGIRTAGTGTTSATTPMIAVGNRPCTGTNPPKFLNAEFNWLKILNSDGRWVEAHDGSTIKVSSKTAIRARVSVGNTQEAIWLAPEGNLIKPGDVVLHTTDLSDIDGRWPLPSATPCLTDVDFGEITLADRITEKTMVEFRMRAIERASFGEKRTFTLLPAN